MSFENVPEDTTYDRNRHASMKMGSIQYGFFQVTTEATSPVFCARCVNQIHGESVKSGGLIYHYECYGQNK